jgi:hypothetical protein
MKELLKKVSTLPKNTISLYLTMYKDKDGEGIAYMPWKALSIIA